MIHHPGPLVDTNDVSIFWPQVQRTPLHPRFGEVEPAVCEELGGCTPSDGRTIDVPSFFIAGKSDWGVYQTPGAVESMQNSACTRMVGFHLLDGAGHWVQQEQPEQVNKLLIAFLQDQRRAVAKP